MKPLVCGSDSLNFVMFLLFILCAIDVLLTLLKHTSYPK